MAVSKTQNERPAITALIDAVNMAEPIVAQNVQNIATLTQGLANEATARAQAVQGVQTQIGDGFAQTSVTTSLSETNLAVQNIDNKIGNGLFSSSFTITQGYQQAGLALQNMISAIDDINQWQDRFKLGLTQNVTIAAGSSASGTLAFESPFGEDAEVAVFPVCVDASGNFTDLSCKLISADYSGFSFAVYNDTQASVTTKVGFLAAKVN